MTEKMVTMIEIEVLMEEANDLGAEIRIKSPKSSGKYPLVFLNYLPTKNKPDVHKFYTLHKAKHWLQDLCGELRMVEFKKSKCII